MKLALSALALVGVAASAVAGHSSGPIKGHGGPGYKVGPQGCPNGYSDVMTGDCHPYTLRVKNEKDGKWTEHCAKDHYQVPKDHEGKGHPSAEEAYRFGGFRHAEGEHGLHARDASMPLEYPSHPGFHSWEREHGREHSGFRGRVMARDAHRHHGNLFHGGDPYFYTGFPDANGEAGGFKRSIIARDPHHRDHHDRFRGDGDGDGYGFPGFPDAGGERGGFKMSLMTRDPRKHCDRVDGECMGKIMQELEETNYEGDR